MRRKKTDAGSWPAETGYSDFGHYLVGSSDLTGTGLESLEVLCSGMRGQMTDTEIRRQRRRTGDSDGSSMKLNVWVNGFLIGFEFNMYGLETIYDSWALNCGRFAHRATPDMVSRTAYAVYYWLKDYGVDDICEDFYRKAEQGVAKSIVDEFSMKKRIKGAHALKV